MREFNIRERIACMVLSNLKHDGVEFIDCRFNDFLLNFAQHVLRVNPIELFTKISNQ